MKKEKVITDNDYQIHLDPTQISKEFSSKEILEALDMTSLSSLHHIVTKLDITPTVRLTIKAEVIFILLVIISS